MRRTCRSSCSPRGPSEDDRVPGLEHGADDYVTKPFSLRELTARVRAVLRRGADGRRAPGRAATTATHRWPTSRPSSVAVDGTPVRLTRREFELLRYLVQNKNRVVSRDRLLERVWGTTGWSRRDRSTSTSGRLRGELAHAGRQIETVVGLATASSTEDHRGALRTSVFCQCDPVGRGHPVYSVHASCRGLSTPCTRW